MGLPELMSVCSTCAVLIMGLASPAEVTWVEGPWVPTVVCASMVDGCRMVRPPAPLPEACAGTPLALMGTWYTLPTGAARLSMHATSMMPIAGASLTRPTLTATTTVTAAPNAAVWTHTATSGVGSTGTVEFNASTQNGCTARVRVRR